MITQTETGVVIEFDDNIQDEVIQSMAMGLECIQMRGIVETGWKPYCIAGCNLKWNPHNERYGHAPECPLELAILVSAVLSNTPSFSQLLASLVNKPENGDSEKRN